MAAQLRLSYAREEICSMRPRTSAWPPPGQRALYPHRGTSLPRSYLAVGVSLGLRQTKALSVAGVRHDAQAFSTHASPRAASLKGGLPVLTRGSPGSTFEGSGHQRSGFWASALGVLNSAFGVLNSAFDVLDSAFGVLDSAFDVSELG